MMDQSLRFAIVGTPNVGKSAVISTLTEDDTVPVDPHAGSTKVCHTYAITIDGGQTLIEFIDTPGFQNPRGTLAWLEEHPGNEAISFFRAEHSDQEDFRHDNELLRPIAEGAGVIYVVNGSDPISDSNQAEMEILRLSAAPRLAIINSKEEDQRFLEKWKVALAQHFNIIWEFNAHHACFAERIALLEALKGIKQEWKPAIDQTVNALCANWEERLKQTTDLICDLLEEALCYEDTIDFDKTNQEEKEKELKDRFCKKVIEIEHDFHEQIRSLFKHNIFKYQPPPDSALRRNLFSEEILKVLGLSIRSSTKLGRLLGRIVSRTQLKMGPLYEPQFFFILLDRVLIFLPYVINWAHGRRDLPPAATPESYTAQWPDEWRNHATKYFTELKYNKRRAWGCNPTYVQNFQDMLMEMLKKLSNAQGYDFSVSAPETFSNKQENLWYKCQSARHKPS